MRGSNIIIASSSNVELAKMARFQGVLLDADKRIFQVLHRSTIIRELEIQGLIGGQPMAFQDYVTRMAAN